MFRDLSWVFDFLYVLGGLGWELGIRFFWLGCVLIGWSVFKD